LALSVTPRLPFAWWKNQRRLEGRITASQRLDELRDDASGALQSTKVKTSLSARLSLLLTPQDTLALTGERVWADVPDYQLSCEYRRTL
jgi:hypothetical protein